MKSNVGSVDRVIRVVLGVALLALAFVGPQTAWGYLGIIPLLSAALGFCPAYALFGVRTCAIRGDHSAVKS